MTHPQPIRRTRRRLIAPLWWECVQAGFALFVIAAFLYALLIVAITLLS